MPHPRADGATHLLLDPLELIETLTLLIPPPRFSHAVLSRRAGAGRGMASAVIAGGPDAVEEGPTAAGPRAAPSPGAVGSPRESASMWAALLRRVFALDVFECPRCGGRGARGGCTRGASARGGAVALAAARVGVTRQVPPSRTSSPLPRSGRTPWSASRPAFGSRPRPAFLKEGRVVEGDPLRSPAGGRSWRAAGGRGHGVATAKACLEFLRSGVSVKTVLEGRLRGR